MAMNESYHKEQEYIWFRGRDLNSFCKAFYEVKGVGHALGGVQRDPTSGSLNVSLHKEQEHIWFRGDLNGFRDIRPFMKGTGHAPRGVQRDPRSGSLNASYHKEQEYIWLRGGNLNGF